MNDTVKLIIEIPKAVYKTITADKYAIYDKMYYPIKNGIPLDDVKAEIEAKKMVETDIERQFYNMALGDVIKILDNIGKESEVKPNE